MFEKLSLMREKLTSAMLVASRCFLNRQLRFVSWTLVCIAGCTGMGAAQTLSLRQTASATTNTGTCQFDAHLSTGMTLITCSGRPTLLTLSFNPTLRDSSLLVAAVLGVAGCIDNRGQQWNGSTFVFSVDTSGYLFYRPPTDANIEGLTSVTCDVSTSFHNVTNIPNTIPGSSGYQGEQILQFFEITSTMPGTRAQGDEPHRFPRPTNNVCQAVPPIDGLAVSGVMVTQNLTNSAGSIISGLPATNNAVSELWTQCTYDQNDNFSSCSSPLRFFYAQKSTYAVNTPAAMQCSGGNCSCFDATFRPVAATDVEIVAGTGSGPEDPSTVSKSALGTLTATFPLGSTFFVQLVRKDSSGARTPLESSFTLGNALVDPAITGETLFPNSVAIEFDRQAVSPLKYFQAVHLGTVNLTITPTDTSVSPVTITINSISPGSLGTTQTAFDPLIIQKAHSKGIPPHFLKAQISRESGFNRNSFRYEVLSYDFERVSRGIQLRSKQPYSLYRLATTDGLIQGTQLLADDIAPRSFPPFPLRIFRDGVLRPMNETDTLVSALEIYRLNEAIQHWNRWSDTNRLRRLERDPTLLDFTAQTTIASSYGLLQIMYETAVEAMAWTGVNGARNPSYLLDTPTNIEAGGGSMELGSGYLTSVFSRANPQVDLAVPNFTTTADFRRAFTKAFNYYNHDGTTGDYGTDVVINRAPSFLPRTATPIF